MWHTEFVREKNEKHKNRKCSIGENIPATEGDARESFVLRFSQISIENIGGCSQCFLEYIKHNKCVFAYPKGDSVQLRTRRPQMRTKRENENTQLTVETMQCDSRMAPQHPKNAISSMTEPIAINAIGATLTLASLKASKISSYFIRNPAPTVINAMPHS